MKTTILSKIFALATIFTLAVGCSSGEDSGEGGGGGGGTSQRPSNQLRLTSDAAILHNLYTTIATFGYAPIFDLSAKRVTLSNGKEFTITPSGDTPSFVIYAEKDEEDKTWYWKYEFEGAQGWLMDSNNARVALLKSAAPIFNTDASGNLSASFDKGQNYIQLSDAAGNKIKITGKHPGLFQAIKGNSNEITITLVNDQSIEVLRKPDQRGALEAIYDACNGDDSKLSGSWKKTDDIDAWYGITCNSEGEITAIDLRKCRLEGVLPDVFAAFPKCTTIRFNNDATATADDNALTGQLPQSMTTYVATTKFYLHYNHFDITDFYIPTELFDIASSAYRVYPQREDSYDFRLFINSDIDGTGPKHGHETCVQVQKAAKGKGIDIYFIGDGYDEENHTKGGTLDFWLNEAVKATFGIHPMDKLKQYFNIYFVYGYSPERGVGLFNNKRNCLYGYWQKNPLKESNCSFNAQNIATTIEKATKGRAFSTSDRAWICMMVNTHVHGGMYRGMQYSKNVVYNGVNVPIAVGINPTYAIEGTAALLQHEFVGHAMGTLLDEYGTADSPVLENPELNNTLYTRNYNVTYESDPTKSPWADFYRDPRYAHEKLGCYAGAWNYGNLYRPTTTSMMRNSSERIYWFNAPSRRGIYSKIMQRAFTAWQFDYEEFVKFDEPEKHKPNY